MKLYIYVTIIIVVGSMLMGTIIYLALDNSHSSGITAMEGSTVAESIAKSWHDDARLTQIGSLDSSEKIEGNAEGWIFTYYSPNTEEIVADGVRYERAHIIVYANNTTSCSYAIRYLEDIGQTIENWTLDSSQAHQITLDNNEIHSFLKKYTHADIGYTLQIRDTYPDRPVWFISFLDMGIMDNPHSAEIYIDANTGEVLYVHADD